jgi:hypothetical protein
LWVQEFDQKYGGNQRGAEGRPTAEPGITMMFLGSRIRTKEGGESKRSGRTSDRKAGHPDDVFGIFLLSSFFFFFFLTFNIKGGFGGRSESYTTANEERRGQQRKRRGASRAESMPAGATLRGAAR